MYINNYLSHKKEVFLSDKEKLSDTYFHDLADFILLLCENQGHIAAARNYYSSTRRA
jgi:hypothetical protein